MKTKPCAELRREDIGLHLSCQPIKISKTKGSDVRRCRKGSAEERSQCQAIDASSDSFHKDSCTEANNIEHFQARGSLSSTSPESVFALCPATLETIFSPVCESDGHCKPTVSESTVTNVDELEAATDEADEGSSSSSNTSEAIRCDEMTFSSTDPGVFVWSFDESIDLDNLIASYPISNCMTVDLEDAFLTLPFLEESIETGNVNDRDTVDEAVVNFDDASLYLAMQQKKRYDETEIMVSYPCDLGGADFDDFDPQSFIHNIPDLSDLEMDIWSTLIPKEPPSKKPVTLVLDLDETLVHSMLDQCEDADFSFPVFFNMEEHIVYVRQRPYLHVFLEKVAELFEVIVFTASQSIYAEQLLDILDPDQKLISRRFYRESCVFSDGSYVKDLSILGQDLSKVAIIDNSPQVFRLQVNNGIPIQSWFDDQSDSALISLLPFLETLADANDVRPIIARKFNSED